MECGDDEDLGWMMKSSSGTRNPAAESCFVFASFPWLHGSSFSGPPRLNHCRHCAVAVDVPASSHCHCSSWIAVFFACELVYSSSEANPPNPASKCTFSSCSLRPQW